MLTAVVIDRASSSNVNWSCLALCQAGCRTLWLKHQFVAGPKHARRTLYTPLSTSIASSNIVPCLPPPPHTHTPANTLPIPACAPGFAGISICNPCAADTFSRGGNTSVPRPLACEACPANVGTLPKAANLTSVGSCVACRAGYGGPLCAICAKGTYSVLGTTSAPRRDCMAWWVTQVPVYGTLVSRIYVARRLVAL